MFRANNGKENSTRIKAFDGDLWRSRVLILQGWKCAQRARGMCAWQAPGSLETWRKWRHLGEKGKFLGGDKIDPDAPLLSGFSNGLSLKQQAGWKCTRKPMGKLSSSTKIWCHRCLEETFHTFHHWLVTQCCVGTKLLDGWQELLEQVRPAPPALGGSQKAVTPVSTDLLHPLHPSGEASNPKKISISLQNPVL